MRFAQFCELRTRVRRGRDAGAGTGETKQDKCMVLFPLDRGSHCRCRVSGHDFSRAAKYPKNAEGFSPCGALSVVLRRGPYASWRRNRSSFSRAGQFEQPRQQTSKTATDTVTRIASKVPFVVIQFKNPCISNHHTQFRRALQQQVAFIDLIYASVARGSA